MTGRTVAATVAAAVVAAWPRPASAYRPFDGTDADVAEPGEFELELGPVHYYRAAGQSWLIAPGGVLNLGLRPRVEIVVDFRNFVALGKTDGPRDRLTDTDLLAKVVLRRGVLQGETGPSVAAEMGVLFPDTVPGSGLGVQSDLIVSLANPTVVVHFNETVADSREHRFAWASGAIVELGPSLPVRPVSELFVERVVGGENRWSALLGAVWRYRDTLVFDVAGRGGREAAVAVWEVRLGFTWAVSWWGSPSGEIRAGG